MPPHAYHRKHPFSLGIPFGNLKYLQLMLLNLSFLLGTGFILLRKQLVISGPLTHRVARALAVATVPIVMWVLSFAYSLLLLLGYRRQGWVTYFALELWPALLVFAFPAMLELFLTSLQTQDPGTGITTGFGSYFNSHLAVIDRKSGDPTLVWQLLLFFGAMGTYLLFVSLTLRGWLLAAGWVLLIPVLSLANKSPLTGLIGFLLISAGIAFLSARRFLNGRDMPVAFWECQARFDLSS